MGLMELTSRLAWPLVVLFAVAFSGLMFRLQIGRLIDRISALRAGPLNIEAGADVAEKAAEVLKNEAPEPAADQLVSGPVPVGPVEKDEEQRRADIEELIAAAVQEGWRLAYVGFKLPPVPRISWDENGDPLIEYSSSDGLMPHNMDRFVVRRGYVRPVTPSGYLDLPSITGQPS